MCSKRRCPPQASSELFSVCVHPAPPTFCCITTWEKLTALSAPGDSLAAEPERFLMRLAMRLEKLELRFEHKPPSRELLSKMARRKASSSLMATKSLPTQFLRASIPDLRLISSLKPSTFLPTFSKTSTASNTVDLQAK